ncbi:MAG TPA: alpha/beta fold hydrolase [Flavihumibacter sp.]|nr:alpha/beta hydrolase [Bacteroidota bacterium]HOA38198.1 alpha/beta fold hydrolase [Flavihumibacter sp.]HPZ89018.1 alpha/beta fold hydrolase [Flavihumibacter sp.]HQD08671.1 alpha/beta fold hydrolase [Flavihumibacter sp.]
MRYKWWWIILLGLLVTYFLGPHPETPVYATALPTPPTDAAALNQYVKALDAGHRLKPDNEARIIWADSLERPTEYSIVYLHGFTASQFEGAPTHTNIARQFGANLYLARLAEHGIDTSDALANLTADKYWASAKEALMIGNRIGKKLILMGTSTGATQALQLAAAYPDKVYALVLLSPNIEINDPNAWLLNNHWGLQIAELVKGGKFNRAADDREKYKQYWSSPYRLEAAVALEEMLETTMLPAVFKQVKQPTLLLYYYKDAAHQDPVVRVSAMRNMFSLLGTADSLKTEKAMPLTGDHVIASPYKSEDAAGVEKEISRFLSQQLKIPQQPLQITGN